MTIYCGVVLVVLMVATESLLMLCFETSFTSPVTSEWAVSRNKPELLWNFITKEPGVVTWMVVTALLVYAMGRLAWFISYIDLRVRYDCWDMELEMFEQARRLREHR